ncbi:EF-hand domain-containing protein [Paludisphaera rhizosphaerae]|uniref:EF-hand domain-containing protein n=1 Tax=Paludisphaera rhizosphaerae TaxID=2711216 RepID=UPI0013EB3786|nr:EF-hand domain-containing protein [Paludisphaera rhizosphaerae]
MNSRFATAAGIGLALIVLPAASRGQELKGVAKRVAEIFAEIDVNHDGVIDQSEIDGANKPAFKKLLAHGDANDDGKIDSKEFETLAQKALTARKDAKKADKPAEAAKPEAAKPDAPKAEMKPEVAKPEPAKPETPNAADGERLGQFIQRFQAMDLDKDGKLTRDEFKGRPAMFDRLDTDHNGVIDKSDLKTLRAKQKAGEAAKAKVDKVKKVKKAAAAV